MPAKLKPTYSVDIPTCKYPVHQIYFTASFDLRFETPENVIPSMMVLYFCGQRHMSVNRTNIVY